MANRVKQSHRADWPSNLVAIHKNGRNSTRRRADSLTLDPNAIRYNLLNIQLEGGKSCHNIVSRESGGEVKHSRTLVRPVELEYDRRKR
ncbi:hypothetical protein EVAR_12437_1 [Eumeta japonica]|uniref:Uncharacterized protein n=1 Tax=Eumeta variegata TaxID=151549 RepID=A0A4C1TZA1_EUMVA|nr:hypothetical protein EVAR_12437_1 [Eumeta japonica]